MCPVRINPNGGDLVGGYPDYDTLVADLNRQRRRPRQRNATPQRPHAVNAPAGNGGQQHAAVVERPPQPQAQQWQPPLGVAVRPGNPQRHAAGTNAIRRFCANVIGILILGLLAYFVMADVVPGGIATIKRMLHGVQLFNHNTTSNISRRYDYETDVRDIKESVYSWANAVKNEDIDTHMSFYAQNLDKYFNRFNVSWRDLYSEKVAAFTSNNFPNNDIREIVVSALGDGSYNVKIEKYCLVRKENSSEYKSFTDHETLKMRRYDGRFKIYFEDSRYVEWHERHGIDSTSVQPSAGNDDLKEPDSSQNQYVQNRVRSGNVYVPPPCPGRSKKSYTPPPCPGSRAVRHKYASPVTKGWLSLNVKHWVEFCIDGNQCYETPHDRIELPTGSHRIELKNPTYGTQSQTFYVSDGQETVLNVDLR